MKSKSFNLGDWIGHISGAIEDERELDGNEMRDLVEFLSELPKWIPVSERLPKVADCYEVTRKSVDDLTVSACYFDGINTWHNGNWINQERNYLTDIVAWKPLPEPYKAETEGEVCKGCHYNDGEVHAECVVCDKAEMESEE